MLGQGGNFAPYYEAEHKITRKKAFIGHEVLWLLACKISSRRKRWSLLFPGVKKQTHPRILSVKVRTRTFCGEKSSEGACSKREHVFSSWTSSSASHKSQLEKEVEFQVAVSKRRVRTQSLKWATLRMTSRGRSRNMYLGSLLGGWVSSALCAGSAHHWW